jgi:hypothetical protein
LRRGAEAKPNTIPHFLKLVSGWKNMPYRSLRNALGWLACAQVFFALCVRPAHAGVPSAEAAQAGALTLAIDLRDTSHKIYRVHETIPARPDGPALSEVDTG